ncbi:hypothetical protein KFK09_018729 [Dendrobium nobile]|uniref:Uncharacterized protein n=1 Tax=Dendrobium nobile TaxID=94219 RepID=A0A8T3B205_DENNO|nr:hypothetical protein KFK09_018729 [Dendrobium nobile]
MNHPSACSSPMPTDKALDVRSNEDKNEASLGAWNLVTRRKKGKSKVMKDQPKCQQITLPPLQYSASKVQQLEETSSRILNCASNSLEYPVPTSPGSSSSLGP